MGKVLDRWWRELLDHTQIQSQTRSSLHNVVFFIYNTLKSYWRTSLKLNTTQNKCIIAHTWNTTAVQTNLFLNAMYIGYWSQTRDGSFFPVQTTFKVNCRFLSQCHYLVNIYSSEMGASSWLNIAALAFGRSGQVCWVEKNQIFVRKRLFA